MLIVKNGCEGIKTCPDQELPRGSVCSELFPAAAKPSLYGPFRFYGNLSGGVNMLRIISGGGKTQSVDPIGFYLKKSARGVNMLRIGLHPAPPTFSKRIIGLSI